MMAVSPPGLRHNSAPGLSLSQGAFRCISRGKRRCLHFEVRGRSGHWKETPIAKTKKPKEDVIPSEDLIA